MRDGAGRDEAVIRARGLTREYVEAGGRRVAVLNGVDLDVARGEVVLVMGPSGSGKTTLLSLLGGILQATAGDIRVAGQPLTDLDQDALSAFRLRRLGFVFQSFLLLDALTALENVALPLRLAGEGRGAARKAAQRLLDELGLGDRRDELPDVLSRGERQRVAVARALVADPAVVLADEPTGSLDARSGDAVVALLASAATRRDAGVVIVTHDPRIEHHADRVLQLEGGRLHDERGGNGSDAAGAESSEHR